MVKDDKEEEEEKKDEVIKIELKIEDDEEKKLEQVQTDPPKTPSLNQAKLNQS